MAENLDGAGQVPTDGDTAAEARAARVAALEEEKRGYEVRGLKDRVKLVDDAIAAFKSAPKARGKAPKDEA